MIGPARPGSVLDRSSVLWDGGGMTSNGNSFSRSGLEDVPAERQSPLEALVLGVMPRHG